jgi:hypothetical protein
MGATARCNVILACLMLLALPGLAAADVLLAVDGGWQDFNWGKNGLYNTEGAFTFSTANPVTLTVTDAFFSGDRFEVYNNNVLMATTSVPVDDGSWVASPDSALLDSKFSSGVWNLAPGSYSLTFKTIQFATGYVQGTGYLRVDTSRQDLAETPEPGALVLAGLGLFGLATRRMLRRRAGPVVA